MPNVPSSSPVSSPRRPSRRRFLAWLGGGSLALSGLLSLWANLRYLAPNVTYGSPRTLRVGRPDDYPPGSKRFLPQAKLYVVREDGGFYAMSAACTHLGCAVNAVDWGFICPCHGGKFDRRGQNLGGPPPRPLPWHKMYLAPSGQLVVDLNRTVAPGTLFKV